MDRFWKHAMLPVSFCMWFSMYVFSPNYTPYLIMIGIAAPMIGLINGLYGFMQMATKIPMGLHTDRHQRYKPFIVVGMLSAALSGFLMGSGTSEAVMLIGRTLTGIATSIWSVCLVLYCKVRPELPSAVAIARMQLVSYLGKLCAYLTCTLMLVRLPMRWVFYCGGAVATVGLIISLLMPDAPKADEAVRRAPLPMRQQLAIIREPNLLLCSLLLLVYQVVSFATVFNYTQVVAKSLDVADSLLGLNSVIYMICCILTTSLLNSKKVNTLPLSWMIGGNFLFFGLYCVFVPLCPSFPLLLLCSAVAGLSSGVLYTRLSSACVAYIAPAEKSTATGYNQAIYALGIMLGPMLMSWMIPRWGMRVSFWVIAGSCFCSVLAAALFFPRIRRRYQTTNLQEKSQ